METDSLWQRAARCEVQHSLQQLLRRLVAQSLNVRRSHGFHFLDSFDLAHAMILKHVSSVRQHTDLFHRELRELILISKYQLLSSIHAVVEVSQQSMLASLHYPVGLIVSRQAQNIPHILF